MLARLHAADVRGVLYPLWAGAVPGHGHVLVFPFVSGTPPPAAELACNGTLRRRIWTSLTAVRMPALTPPTEARPAALPSEVPRQVRVCDTRSTTCRSCLPVPRLKGFLRLADQSGLNGLEGPALWFSDLAMP